jgi:S1-C subfamily serine protease
VSVIVYKESPPGSKKLKKVADATGTIVSSSGYIITNYHVVSKGTHFEVISYKGEMLELKKFYNGNTVPG